MAESQPLDNEWSLPLEQLRTLYMTDSGDSPVIQDSPIDVRGSVGMTKSSSSSTSLFDQSGGTTLTHKPSIKSHLRVSSASEHSPRLGSSHPLHPGAGPASIAAAVAGGVDSSSDPSQAPLYSQSRLSLQPFPATRLLVPPFRKRILVSGGAGFLGSHLVDRLMIMGHDVMVLDNFFTGQKSNVSHWLGHANFELVRHDVVNPILLEVDQIYHLACPASPQHYQANQIKTIKTNFLGTSNMLGLAKRTKARFLLASTSEVYGDPDVTPQKETYNGNVNQTGPRACYDEGKRVAETLTYGYHYQDRVDVRVARIFNTYGPRMNPYDGRVMSNFLIQALKGERLTVYGEGKQTRSFCFIHDLVDGLIALMNAHSNESSLLADPAHSRVADVHLPVNLGSDKEFTIRQLVDVIFEVLDELKKEDQLPSDITPLTKEQDRIRFLPMPVDDPRQRRPDIERARSLLGWQPSWDLQRGIREMALYYIQQIQSGHL